MAAQQEGAQVSAPETVFALFAKQVINTAPFEVVSTLALKRDDVNIFLSKYNYSP